MPLRILIQNLLLAAGMAGARIVFAGPVVTIATGEYQPWTSEHLPHGGFINHVVTEAFRAQGIETRFVYLPWKRTLEDTRQGVYDATSYWYYKAEREQDFIHSPPVNHERIVFFGRKGRVPERWSTLAELAGLRIGATRGFTYSDEFWRLAGAGLLNVEQVRSDELNMRKLIAGRIDLFPVGEQSGWHILMHDFSEKDRNGLFTLQPPLAEVDGYILFSRKRPEVGRWVAAFRTGLQSLEKSGRLAQMRQDLVEGRYSTGP